jgi:glutathione S-transferase
MKLHWSPRSPFVRKVMVAAHEAGVADQLACVRTVVGGTVPHLELMRENPLGKLPTLVLEDGTIIYDSLVICTYFDTVFAPGKLIPIAWPARLAALRRHALGNGMLDICLQWLGERARPAERQSPSHIALWQGKIRACIGALETESLANDAADIGHLTIAVALSYLDFRFATENWRNSHPRLSTWMAKFDQRPSMRATLPVDDS